MPELHSGGSKVAGWLKALATTMLGLCSGAVLMYVSPPTARFASPPRPVANSPPEPQGLTVHFHNRSTGGSEGWWDFGDGSALEPYAAGQDDLTHTYARAGVYT